MPVHRINFECRNCGSSNIKVPNDTPESERVVCNECGEFFGTVGQIKDELRRQARETRH